MKLTLNSPWLLAAGKVGGVAAIPRASTGRLTIKANGKRSRSALQMTHTSTWQRIANKWKHELTKAQKDSWKTFGGYHAVTDLCGNSHALSGRSAFIRSNVRLGSLKLPPLNGAPSTWSATDPGTITVNYTAGPPATLTLSPTNNPLSNEVAVILARSPVSPGQKTAAKRAYKLAIESAPTTPPWDVAPEYQFKYGKLRPGQNVILQVFYCDVNSGYESPRRQGTLVIP